MKVSMREAGSKKKFAEAFIEKFSGGCTIHQYRAAAEADPDYHGNMLGSEFYQAANRWRAERGLCKLSEISLPAGEAAMVSQNWTSYDEDRRKARAQKKSAAPLPSSRHPKSAREAIEEAANLGKWKIENPNPWTREKVDTWKSVLLKVLSEAQNIESVMIQREGPRVRVEFDFTTD